MNGRNPVNWKMAAAPAVVLTAALAVGVGYFAGGSGDSPASSRTSAEFKFEAGPKYAPGSSPLARTEQQSGSSIEIFRKVNEGYSKETASAKETPAKARRQMTKAELREFMRQSRAEIKYDQEAMAAAQAQEAQQQGKNLYRPGNKAGTGGGAAAPEAVSVAQGQPAPRLQASGSAAPSAGGRSSFTAGFSGAGLSRGGRQGAGPQGRFGQGSESTSDDSSFSSQGGQGSGRDLNAGAYGSHGGGRAGAPSGQTPESASSSAGGPEEKIKREPMPVAFIWPRSLDFGKMYNYETGARLVVIMNIGDAELRLGKIENMDDETPFYLEKDHCSSARLAPKKSCTFRVRFSPKAAREYYSGLAIGSNDDGAMDYQTYIELKGESKYSYLTWWWRNNWNGSAGYANRLDFELVPEGYSMDEVLRVYNTSGETWHRMKLDTSRLPGVFKIASDGCTGQALAPHQSCAVTVNFVPDSATNRKFCAAGYGQYHSVNLTNGAKQLHSRPKFPPLVLEKPVEALPKGELRVLADHEEYYNRQQLVLTVPISGKSSAPFPVYGLERVQHYYYFR